MERKDMVRGDVMSAIVRSAGIRELGTSAIASVVQLVRISSIRRVVMCSSDD